MTSDEWQVTSAKKVRFGDAPQAGRRGDRSTTVSKDVVGPRDQLYPTTLRVLRQRTVAAVKRSVTPLIHHKRLTIDAFDCIE